MTVSLVRNCLGMVGCFRSVLRADQHRVHADRLVPVVLDRQLALRVGAQPGKHALLPQLGLLLHQPVRVVDRERHELGRLVARETEHQALVARALFLVESFTLGDALTDVGRLRVDADLHFARVRVHAPVRVRVPDAADRLPRDRFVVDLRSRRDLAGDDAQVRRDEGLASDAALGVARQARVEDRVRDLVGHLVGVTHGDGFGSEEHSGHGRWKGQELRSGQRWGAPSPGAIPQHTRWPVIRPGGSARRKPAP